MDREEQVFKAHERNRLYSHSIPSHPHTLEKESRSRALAEPSPAQPQLNKQVAVQVASAKKPNSTVEIPASFPLYHESIHPTSEAPSQPVERNHQRLKSTITRLHRPGTGLRANGGGEFAPPMMGSWNSPELVKLDNSEPLSSAACGRGICKPWKGSGPFAPADGNGAAMLPTLWLRRLTGPMGRAAP